MKKLLHFLLVNFLFSSTIVGYIYEIKVLRKWNKEEQRYTYFIGCSDFHDKQLNANQEQRTEIGRVLKDANTKNIKVILEDLSSPNNRGCYGCNCYRFNSKKGILAGLTRECKKLGIVTENIEYRFCRVISTTGMLMQLRTSPFKFEPACTILVKRILDEFEKAKNEIEAFNDGHRLKKVYKREIKKSKKGLEKLNIQKYASDSIATYVDSVSNPTNRLGFLKRFLTFDSMMVDCKLSHCVLQNKKPVIIAFAGGTHIERAAKMLQVVGFEEVTQTNLSYYKERNLQKCLGSHVVDGQFCVRPQPITLDLLKKYLKKAKQ